ncbi:MAG TPA: ABC transporter ATP-binding protein [Microvirga sp.]|jgi:ABC-type multidrug transport system fused ATPase/permease subunit|nr:ABC transporter ATP-binding protein [Microvirga sp.]
MERTPLRLAWSAAPSRHLAAGACLALAGALLMAGLDAVRAVVDSLLAGGAPGLLVPALWGPYDPSGNPWTLLGALAGIPALMAVVMVAVRWIAAGIGARALGRIRGHILDALIAAPPSARDEAAAAAAMAGETLSHDGRTLGTALITPVQSGGAILVSLAFAALVDWRLAAAMALALALSVALSLLRLESRALAAQAQGTAGNTVDRLLADLLRRLPALRAHGTGPFERDRLQHGLRDEQRAVKGQERRLALVEGLSIAALMLTPLAVLGAGAALQGSGSPGGIVAAALAAALASWSVREVAGWLHHLAQARPTLAEAARAVEQLRARGQAVGTTALPGSGALVARGVSAYDPASGGRVSGIDLRFTCPAHVALLGDGEAGPRMLAALIGGQLDASTGSLTFGGADLAKASPVDRARRIAYAGGEAVLIPGTLRQNLVYGCPADATDLEGRLADAIGVAGLDGLVHARGLEGSFDPAREPKLAAAIVETRRAVRAGLARDGLDRYVDPFDARLYNHHATIGENLLFGQPIGPTFREANLASHPYVRAVLEAEELTKPLAAVGLQIAASMTEIFADIPEGSPLFQRFSFFSAGDRAFFEDLLERRSAQRRSGSTGRDRERLIGLALRYSESRHRLGLIDDALRDRLLGARASFAAMLPTSLQPFIEFYDEGRLCTAASVQDNLLFGRIASDQAGAEAAVHAVMRRVLTERGLDRDVSRIGLDTPVDVRGADLTSSERAAVDLVRCLVRRPDVVVVERALDGLPAAAAEALVARLRRFLVGRGLILVTSDLTATMDSPAFDAVIRFERGATRLEERRQRSEELMPA